MTSFRMTSSAVSCFHWPVATAPDFAPTWGEPTGRFGDGPHEPRQRTLSLRWFFKGVSQNDTLCGWLLPDVASASELRLAARPGWPLGDCLRFADSIGAGEADGKCSPRARVRTDGADATFWPSRSS
jgi:hypothetical protein